MIKSYKEEYPWIFWSFVISVIIVVLYSLFSVQIEEYGFSKVGVVLFQLSIGLIINSFFFYSQIYLIKKKQKKYIDSCIAKRIDRIVKQINMLFDQLNSVYRVKENLEQYNKEDFFSLLKKTKLSDRVPIINPELAMSIEKHFSIRDYLMYTIRYVENEIDILFKHYESYLSPELMNDLEEILYSTMHNSLGRCLLQISGCQEFSSCNNDPFYFPYYSYSQKLGRYTK